MDLKLVSTSSEMFRLIPDATKVNFIANKTTEKLPVVGNFKQINLTKNRKAKQYWRL